MIGEIINDKYKIESVFNESHMYELFTAIEISTGSTVVLKLMKEEMAINAERVKNFSDEIKNFAGLSHPLIAEILDLDMYEDRPYVVSPLIDGISLKQVISNEVLSLPDSVKVIQDMAAVLQCAADKKIENRNRIIPIKDNKATYVGLTWDINPMIGVIGLPNNKESINDLHALIDYYKDSIKLKTNSQDLEFVKYKEGLFMGYRYFEDDEEKQKLQKELDAHSCNY